jgi:exopolyphosphatase/guanosine-5'-triphosphate,3'-diphosphate pyrophosphatase
VSADGTLIIDVGGGSTELVLGAAGGVAWSRSLQAGCVRMTERFLGEDVIAQEALDAAAAAVGELLGVVPGEVIDATRRAIAVAGTATTLAAIAHGGYEADAVHGAHITREQVRDTQRHLAGLSLARRREVPGLEPARAPVIVAGLVVLGSVLDRFCLAGALVSERDILHGAALLAAAGALRV